MVDEKHDEYENHEESEYHFSDDQLDYDFESEIESPAPVVATEKPSVLSRLSQHRKKIISGIVFLVLVFVVYKMLIPLPAPINTEITQAAPARSEVVVPQKPLITAMTPSPVAAQPAVVPEQSVVAPTVSQASVPQRTVLERLAILEEENTKIVTLLQSQYAQKMADYEAQNNANQEKLQELNKRLASMETSLAQMTRLLERTSKHPVAMEKSSLPAMRSSEPKIMYTVQAIIPGRAWLKSDVGEAVTVAEGDMLKQYGRVVKIDPYDGVVEIDRGGKIITLSYGATESQ